MFMHVNKHESYLYTGAFGPACALIAYVPGLYGQEPKLNVLNPADRSTARHPKDKKLSDC